MVSTVVISVCASLLGVIIGLSFQKYMNDRDKKFAAYIEMIEAIADSTQADKRKEGRKKFISAKQKIVIYGSHEVISLLADIPAFNSSDEAQYQTYLNLVSRMRRETTIIPFIFSKDIPKDLLRKILG
ncbi:MAG: hypothetical protein AB9858_08970 [Acidaminococcaceae bacterium]